MKAKKYVKSTTTMLAIKKYFNVRVIASLVASLMLLYTPVALYNYTKENGTLLYDVAEAQITSTVPIVKGEIKTQTEVEEVSSYSVDNGFEEAEKNRVGTYTSSNNNQNTRPSSTPTTNNQQSNNQGYNSQNNNEVSKDLSFLKGTSISILEGESFDPITNLGIVAHDKDGKDITNRVSIDENNVDVNNEGSYYVKASIKLNDGSTLEKVFTVKVNPKKEVTYEVNNFEMLEKTAPKLGTARIFFDSKVSDDTISPLKATVNGIEYNINDFGKSSFGGTIRHYIDVNVGDISGEFKLNIEKIEFSNGVSIWPAKQMNIYVIKSEPVVSNFSYTEDEEGKISTTFDLKDLDNSLSNIKVSLYNEKGILVEEYKVAKKEKYNLDFNVQANGKYTLEVIGDVNLYNDLSRLNQDRVILSEDIQISKIIDKSEVDMVDKSKLEANDVEITVGEELNIGDLNIIALDKNGEDISSKVEIDTSKLDITNVGKYEVLLTVLNSDNSKLEKVISVVVKESEVYNSTESTRGFKSLRIVKENDYQNNSDYIEKINTRNLVSGDSSNPIYTDLDIHGNVSTSSGGAPQGKLEVSVPTQMNFMIDQNGNFNTATNYNIENKSSYPIEVSVVEFTETNSLGGINVMSTDVSDNNKRNEINLSISTNQGKVKLCDKGIINEKIAEIPAISSSMFVLEGKAGKAKDKEVDNKGATEKFILKFRIKKA